MKKKNTKKVAKKAAKKVVKKITIKTPSKKATVKKTASKKSTTKKVVAKKKAASAKQSASLINSGIPDIGEQAPEFTLQDQNGNNVSLIDLRGMNVVLYFYPKAMTPGCTVQACSLRDTEAELKELDIVVLAISADPVKKLKQFEEKDKLNFTLLSDPEHKVIEAYGSWGQKKFMGREFMGILRQTFLIDRSGKIVHVMHKVETKSHHDVVINFFKHQQ